MEMFFLRNLDAKDKKAYHEYRMQVKRRIYKQNEVILSYTSFSMQLTE